MWALVIDGLVRETTLIDPEGRFHEDLKWYPCDEQVTENWIHSAEGFIEPASALDTLLGIERIWRDLQLNATEWIVSRHRDEVDMQLPATLTAEQFAELLVFRQHLRDWPQAEDFPQLSGRPMWPAWLAEDGSVVVASEPETSDPAESEPVEAE